MIRVILKKGRDDPIRRGHPWVFSGAVGRVEGTAEPGDPCRVVAHGGEVLGVGYYNSRSSIAVRMFGRGDEAFTGDSLALRVRAAVARRSRLVGPDTDTYRLVNSEGDFLPGLIVDRYGPGLCVQILTAGMERWRERIVAELVSLLAPSFVCERSDSEARGQEGLAVRSGMLYGELPDEVRVTENGVSFVVDLEGGQKTGFYTDQRCNRLLFRSHADRAGVCDCFAYTGAFSLYARLGGASRVDTVDSSAPALAVARRNLELNGVDLGSSRLVEANVFDFLRAREHRYDLMVLDPPKFARHRRDVAGAARGYKDINLMAMRCLTPGGVLFTFSCSQAVDTRLFRQIVFGAAADSGRELQVLHVLTQPPDHPVNIAHPEGEYLKGLVLRVAG
jgi:23S rRNA (cytosine1962-C5)-methyltransferase